VEDDIVYSKDVLEFVTVAAEYCSFVEAVNQYSKKDFLNKSQKLLSVIYLKISIIPKVEPIYEDGNEKFVNEEDWLYIKESVSNVLGKHEQFIDIYNPVMAMEDDSENIALSEIFADIYQDLMDFVTLYRIGHEESMNDALWECQQNFEQYWGTRLLSAQLAIHNILYGGEDLSEEENKNENKEIKQDTSNWIFTQRKKEWGLD
jgi:hypothetical protein